MFHSATNTVDERNRLNSEETQTVFHAGVLVGRHWGMPRRRSTASSPLKRPADENEDPVLQDKKRKLDDQDDRGSSEQVQMVEVGIEDGEAAGADGSSLKSTAEDTDVADEGNEEEGDSPRRRRLSASSGQRNLSLEALFQVTDTELQAISKQGPEQGHRLVEIDHNGQPQTVLVIDTGIQEREELVGEQEVPQQQDVVRVPVTEASIERFHLKSDTLEKQGLKLMYTKKSDDEVLQTASTPSPSTSRAILETPSSKQFSNIERILQKAGIDTSSKTWKNLTRPGRHICPYCQRGCAKPSVLEKHIRAHTGERPFPCLVCGFSFKTKSNLYKHCKSRAHSLKVNIESKKMKTMEEVGDSSVVNEIEVPMAFESDGESGEIREETEKKPEHLHAQKHVIQEVVKYLEKGKGQRPSEVQTERQRAKLERLKSLQEKSGDVKKKVDEKTLFRQLSLPVMSSKVQFQRIAPKGASVEYLDSTGIDSVSSPVQMLRPGSLILNEEGQVIHTVPCNSGSQVNPPASESSLSEWNVQEDADSSFCNRIEIVNLPNPDSDPDTANKALHDLEELSEKFSKAAKEDGARMSTSVQSLPDKRVQVVIQLQQEEKQLQKGQEKKEARDGDPLPVTKVISTTALKERIQQLISANAAIVDTPKVEPPRAKCVKRVFSRQDSELSQTSRSETETAVSDLLMPNINSVPLQPLPIDSESGLTSHARFMSSQDEVNMPIELGSRSVIVEKIEHDGECLFIVNNDAVEDDAVKSDEEGTSREPTIIREVIPVRAGDAIKPIQQTQKSAVSQVQSHKVVSCHSNIPGTKVSSVSNMQNFMLVPGSSLGLASHVSSSQPIMAGNGTLVNMPSGHILLASQNTAADHRLVQGFPVSHASPLQSVSKLAETSIVTAKVSDSSLSQSPGNIGKLALKNQMRSKSVSSLPSAQSSAPTPVIISNPNSQIGQGTMNKSNAPIFFCMNSPQMATAPVSSPAANKVQPVLLRTGSTPVLLVNHSSAATFPKMSQLSQSPFILQQQSKVTEQNSLVGVIQSPSVPLTSPKTQKVTKVNVVKTQPIISNQQKSSTVVPSPQLLYTQTGTPTDPMKILSTIVSNTVGQQVAGNSSGKPCPKDQAKEIKIEIKLTQASSLQSQQNISVSSPAVVTRSRPVLKRQNSVSMETVPVALSTNPKIYSQPVFRFQTAASKLMGTTTQLTPPVQSSNPPIFKFQTARTQSVGDQIITQTSQITDPKVIKELLLKGRMSVSKSFDEKLTNDSPDRPYRCMKCNISFKKKETLDLHESYYCKKQTDGGISKDAVAKLFVTQSGSSVKSFNVSKYSRSEFFEDFEPGFSQMAKRKIKRESKDITDNEESCSKSEKIFKLTTKADRPLKSDKLKSLEEKLTKSASSKKTKDIWQSKLKGQILKRKLKGKLLLKRSMSVNDASEDSSKKNQIPNKIGLKTRFAEVDIHKGPVLSKLRSGSSTGSVMPQIVTIKKPEFQRSESVPSLQKSKAIAKSIYETVDESEGEEEAKSPEEMTTISTENPWRFVLSFSVPVVLAQSLTSAADAPKPIYQQNNRMKMFAGMGTPAQLMPSMPLTPRSELLEIESVQRRFSFESRSVKVCSSKEVEKENQGKGSMKLSGGESSSLKKLSPSSLPSPLKSSKLLTPVHSPATPVKSPSLRQFSLVGHSYPSLRSLTHMTFCCVNRLQPMYVIGGRNKKVSMYSNWCIAQVNNNPLGLSTKKLLSLYNSRYTTNPVLALNSGSDPHGGVITHSSYWTFKQEKNRKEQKGEKSNAKITLQSTDSEADKAQSESSEKKVLSNQKQIQGGYKSSESYVYVRGRGRGKYVCDTCGIRCKKPSMLKKHIRTHTDYRPYNCRHCKFSFKTKGNLTKHMKSKSHSRKCIELGIVPVPTAVEESQIDIVALKAQCSISKQARIALEAERSFDDDDFEDGDEDDDEEEGIEEEDDDGEGSGMDMELLEGADNSEEVDEKQDAMETAQSEEEKDTTMDVSESIPITKEAPEIPSSQMQRNLFLQTLGIIAKQLVTEDNSTVPVSVSLSQMGTSLGPLEACTSQAVSLSKVSEVTTSLTASSLSTVYGKFNSGQEDETATSKDCEIIWGLLNLSDQGHKAPYAGKPILPQTGLSDQEKPRIDEDRNTSTVKATSESMGMVQPQTTQNPSQDVLVTVPLGGYVPPMLNTSLSLISTSSSTALKNGPIVGQMIRNVDSTSKADGSEKSKSENVFVPFQFHHPFPGSETVTVSPSKALVSESQSTVVFETQKTNNVQSDSVVDRKQDVEPVIKTASQNENVYIQVGTLQMGTIQAQIVSLDPDMFKANTNLAETSQAVSEIPLENVVQLKQVSGDVFMIEDQNNVENAGPKNLAVQRIDLGSGHVTGSEDHGSDAVSNEGQDGRFTCNMCKASFPEHHQLILHSNIHLMDRSRIKCDKCNLRFRSHTTYEKHLLSDLHLGEDQGEVIVPTTDNPRPFKCEPCQIAFRMRGHLTKHFRSRSHFVTLENLGKIPLGTWGKLEYKVLDIEAANLDSFLKKVQILLEADQKGADLASLEKQSRVCAPVITDTKDTGYHKNVEVMLHGHYQNDFPDDSGNHEEKVKVEMNDESIEIGSIGQGDSFAEEPLSGEIQSDDLFETPLMDSGEENYVDSNPLSFVSTEVTSESFVIDSSVSIDSSAWGSSESLKQSGNTNTEPVLESNENEVLDEGEDQKVIAMETDSRAVKESQSFVYQEQRQASFNQEHRKKKPHKCGLCRRGFETVSLLKTHLITHAELRPYVCEYCDAGFTNAQSLKIHLKTHTQETPYVCGVCGMKFANSHQMSDHVEDKHAVEGESDTNEMEQDSKQYVEHDGVTRTSEKHDSKLQNTKSKVTDSRSNASDLKFGDESFKMTSNEKSLKGDDSCGVEHLRTSTLSSDLVYGRSNKSGSEDHVMVNDNVKVMHEIQEDKVGSSHSPEKSRLQTDPRIHSAVAETPLDFSVVTTSVAVETSPCDGKQSSEEVDKTVKDIL